MLIKTDNHPKVAYSSQRTKSRNVWPQFYIDIVTVIWNYKHSSFNLII